MHTIEKKKVIPVIISVTQFRSRERRKLPPALNVRAGSRPPAEPLHPVLSNATENPEGVNLFLL